ncbi:hypothetical protein RIR_jg17865.t1 [Rhizophagus irregularis DAOM 181602=DAOM 197198]|nr:hypothetical protein RIR_jg17865.t1 [Rhizophagus irregularis DAOM 181602=DAOM 197198]
MYVYIYVVPQIDSCLRSQLTHLRLKSSCEERLKCFKHFGLGSLPVNSSSAWTFSRISVWSLSRISVWTFSRISIWTLSRNRLMVF